MEADDPTQYFKNRMRISLEGSSAVWRTSWRSPTDLPLQWLDDSSFAVDWAPVCSRWGRGVFRVHYHLGVKGLLEDGQKFWKYMAPRVGNDEDSRHRVTSRSPRLERSLPSTCGDLPGLHGRLGTFPKVLYINLARRTDRRDEILTELATLGIDPAHITRIEAIDAAYSGESPLECCARSHVAALELAIMEDLEAVLILEDDFQLSCSARETRRRWEHFLRTVPHFDIVSWAHNCMRPWSRGGSLCVCRQHRAERPDAFRTCVHPSSGRYVRRGHIGHASPARIRWEHGCPSRRRDLTGHASSTAWSRNGTRVGGRS